MRIAPRAAALYNGRKDDRKRGEHAMLESLWREDFTLHSLNALRQYWQEGESYTFRRSPRPQHGLMLLTGGETLY